MLVEPGDHVNHRKARARGPLRIVIVGLGTAEVGHEAVAKVLATCPPKRVDRLAPPRDSTRETISRHCSGSSALAISVEPTR